MKVRVAIAGSGNCGSALLQGLEYYRDGKGEGLWHPKVGGLSAKDVEIVSAFDVDARKVGLDFAQAVMEEPTVARAHVKIERQGVMVSPGLLEDKPAPHLEGQEVEIGSFAGVCKRLEESRADLLVNLISSGLDRTARAYAKACLRAGCHFVNCTPSQTLHDKGLVAQFKRSRRVIVGDDLMSQFGGTIFHRGILKFMVDRGMKVLKSYQLDVGGGSETFNTMDEEIKGAKRKVKTESVGSEVPYKFETVAGTTDYVDYMGNDRTSYFWVEGSGFLGAPATLDLYLRTSDSANAGNILLDVIRATHAAAQSGSFGAVNEICAYGFKSPPEQLHYDEAYSRFRARFL